MPTVGFIEEVPTAAAFLSCGPKPSQEWFVLAALLITPDGKNKDTKAFHFNKTG